LNHRKPRLPDLYHPRTRNPTFRMSDHHALANSATIRQHNVRYQLTRSRTDLENIKPVLDLILDARTRQGLPKGNPELPPIPPTHGFQIPRVIVLPHLPRKTAGVLRLVSGRFLDFKPHRPQTVAPQVG
ncbi:MAG: hypothetical protein AAGG44_08370, partial [Planctomycetota bacterium]